MTSDGKNRIANFFQENSDGDFIHSAPAHPTIAIPKANATRGVLYATKPAVISHAIKHCSDGSIAIVGGGGLPSDEQTESIQNNCAGAKTGFLGDCDPVDLLIFSALRDRIDMTYIGVNDALISDLEFDVTNYTTIRLSSAETNAIAVLSEVGPDYEALIGPNCRVLWRDGRKLELEAVFNFARVDGARMFSALCARSLR